MSAMLWGNFEWWCQLQLRTWNVQFRGSNWELTLWQDFFLSITLAPLHDSHHFKTETKQCLIGLGNLGPGILPSLSSSSSHFHQQTEVTEQPFLISVCPPKQSWHSYGAKLISRTILNFRTGNPTKKALLSKQEGYTNIIFPCDAILKRIVWQAKQTSARDGWFQFKIALFMTLKAKHCTVIQIMALWKRFYVHIRLERI